MEGSSFTPSKPALLADCPFSPATCYKNLVSAVNERDDILEFQKTEALVDFEEFKSMEQSLKDANALLSDGQKTIMALQKENSILQNELAQYKEAGADQKESNLKMFRLQQELEQKNIEILRLKKDRSEFDLQLDLLKSRFARKEKEFTDAAHLQPVHSSDDSEINKLKAEINELKLLQEKNQDNIENLEEVLKIRAEHNGLLLVAYDELVNEFKQISAEMSDVVTSLQSVEEVSFVFDLEPLDLGILGSVEKCNIDFPSSCEFTEYVEKNEADINIEAVISTFSSWCKSLIDEWLSDAEASKIDFNDKNENIDEIISICKTLINKKTTNVSSTEMATSMACTETHAISLQTSLPTDEDDLKDEWYNKIAESELKLKNASINFEKTIASLVAENKELLQKYNSVKDVLEEAEKQHSLIEEATAEVVKELKDDLGDRTVKMLLNGEDLSESLSDCFVDCVMKEELQFNQTSGTMTFLSAKEEPDQSIYEEANATSSVLCTLPREHSDNLVSFAREFAEFLVANQIFNADDELPADPSVFYFLLDRYLILVDTYHATRTALQGHLTELEEQNHVTSMKAEALVSQVSLLGMTSSTLCDSSLTDNSMDFGTDVRSSTLYETVQEELTHDPLHITINNNPPSTPLMYNSRLSFRDQTPAARKRNSLNNSRIPVSRVATPAMRSKTIPDDSIRQSILINGSMNDSKLPPSTPAQKILRRDPCSTVKKSVTFQSPLLAKNMVERENSRLKSVLDEKNALIERLEHSISGYESKLEIVEERVVGLESVSQESYASLERAETEFSEKRLKLEEELNHVRSQLSAVTNKLIVEAINLNPDLHDRLTAITPHQVLTILLNTIIARFEKEQESTKKTFESDREEWSNEIIQLTANNQSLQQEIKDLTSHCKQIQVQCDDLKAIEEDLLRISGENVEFEKINAALQKESIGLHEKLSSVEKDLSVAKEEIVTLSDKLALSEAETTNLANDKLQLEQDNEKYGKECDNQLKTLQDSMSEKSREVELLNEEITVLKTNLLKLEEINEKITKDYENNTKVLEEKDKQLHDVQGELDVLKNTIVALEKEIVDLNSKSTLQLNTSEEVESLKLALENSTKEKECLQLQNDEFKNSCSVLQLSLSQISNERSQLEGELQLAQSAIDCISKKYLCENNMPSDLEAQINLVCEFVSKKLTTLEEENERITLLESDISEVRREKENVDGLVANIRMESQALEAKVSQLEADKNRVENELVELKQRIIHLEEASNQLNNAMSDKDQLLSQNSVELEMLRAKVSEITGEVESNEVKIQELKRLQEQKLQVESKQAEIIALKEENVKISEELSCLKAEHENILSKMINCNQQFELEAGKNREASLNFNNLQKEVGDLKIELEGVRGLEDKRKTELNVIIIEKSKMEECLAVVEKNLRLAEERLVAAEKRNLEFKSELLLLKDELMQNKNTIKDLIEKLSILEKIYGEVKREKLDLSEQVEKLSNLNENLTQEKNEMIRQIADLMQEIEDLVNKLAASSEERNKIENDLKNVNSSLQSEKEEISGKLTELKEKYVSENNVLVQKVTELLEIQTVLTSEKESLLTDLRETKSAAGVFSEEKKELVKIHEEHKQEKDMLNEKLKDLSRARENLEAEKNLLTTKLNELVESMKDFNSEKESLVSELQTVVEDRTVLMNEKSILEGILIEEKEEMKLLTREKSILIAKLDEISQSHVNLEAEKNVLEAKVNEFSGNIEKLSLELNAKSNNIVELAGKLESVQNENDKLRESLEEYKKTESSMLKKLLEKNTSDEMACRLQKQLENAENLINRLNAEVESLIEKLNKKSESLEAADAELLILNKEIKKLNTVINNLARDNDELNYNFKELKHKSKSLDDVTAQMENLKCQVAQKEKESEEANSLLSERSEKINDLNNQMEKLSNNNAELKELLGHVQVSLGLPKEAVEHLSANQNTRSSLRLFKDNVNGFKSRNHAISVENEKLIVELEKLTTEKVQFKIREAELSAFGRDLEDQIEALKSKLSKLESAPSRRSKRHEPITPRRLEKLEDLNTSLHDLLIKLLTMLQLPNVDKLRLISQREVDGATKQILEHAAILVNAWELEKTLKEQVKSLDQENQELSDDYEAMLKDNNRLELEIMELKKTSQSSACSKCSELRQSLKEKSDEVSELNQKVKELDAENESLSNDVDALLKDNNKLELELDQIRKGAGSVKTCSACSATKKMLRSKEEEISQLDLNMKGKLELVKTLESELNELKNKCETLESSLSNREQHLLRAINDRVLGNEVRMSGASGGLVRDIDLNEKVRRMTKDNDALKVLLRERARTIKKYEAEQKGKTTPSKDVILNTNSMDSPIRERGYNLRTRASDFNLSKRNSRPFSEGIENLRL